MCQPSLHGCKSLTSKKSIYWLTCTHFHVEKVWITYSSLSLHSQWYWHSCSRDVAVKASQLWVVHIPCGPGFGRTCLLLPWEREKWTLKRKVSSRPRCQCPVTPWSPAPWWPTLPPGLPQIMRSWCKIQIHRQQHRLRLVVLSICSQKCLDLIKVIKERDDGWC